jgi:hypothetical protein
MYVSKRPQVGRSPVAFVPVLHNFKLATSWNTNEYMTVKCERREYATAPMAPIPPLANFCYNVQVQVRTVLFGVLYCTVPTQ